MQLNKHELLKYLRSLNDRGWLWYDADDGEGDRLLDHSVALEKLIEVRLQQITSRQKNYSRTIVLVAETNPIAFLATFIAGTIAQVDLLLCDSGWQRREWEQVLGLIKPDLIYCDRATEKLIAKVESIQPVERELPHESLILIPTGGTSGKIRFAMHTWETLAASVLSFQEYFGCQYINSCCTLPLYHVSGLMQFMRSFMTQGNLVICSYKALQTRQLFLDRSDYFISLVPTQLQYLIAFIPEWLAEFKTVLLGGAPPMRSLLDMARKYHIPIALTYGMTETASGVVTLKPQDFLAGNNSSGRVLPHTNIKIVKNSQSQDRELVAANFNARIGLVEINCSSLCLGYYPRIFTAKDTLITDDLGYLDRDGYLYLVGRNSQKIITGGENVFPAEVESAIYATGLVKDVCAIGISDRFWGQVVTAIYVPLESSHNLNLIQQKVRQQLAKYKQPKHWIEIDRIPRNDRGKINYQKLQEIATHKLSSI